MSDSDDEKLEFPKGTWNDQGPARSAPPAEAKHEAKTGWLNDPGKKAARVEHANLNVNAPATADLSTLASLEATRKQKVELWRVIDQLENKSKQALERWAEAYNQTGGYSTSFEKGVELLAPKVLEMQNWKVDVDTVINETNRLFESDPEGKQYPTYINAVDVATKRVLEGAVKPPKKGFRLWPKS